MKIKNLFLFLAMFLIQTAHAYYDPTAGRFFSFDPIAPPAGSMDGYSFANGDPANQFDADGRLGKAAHDMVGMAAYSLNGNPEDFQASSRMVNYTLQQNPDTIQRNILYGTVGAEALIAAPWLIGSATEAAPAVYVGATQLAYNPVVQTVAVSGLAAGLSTWDNGGSPDQVVGNTVAGAAFGYGMMGMPNVRVNAPTTFLGQLTGPSIIVPRGAIGPSSTRGSGFQFTGGSGGYGLDPRVSSVRIMDPTSRYPAGYVSYDNANTPSQTVNPYTGRTIPPSDPAWHNSLHP